MRSVLLLSSLLVLTAGYKLRSRGVEPAGGFSVEPIERNTNGPFTFQPSKVEGPTPNYPVSGQPSQPWIAASTPGFPASGQPSRPWEYGSTSGYQASGKPNYGSTQGYPASGAPSKPWYAGSTPGYAVSGQPSQPWIAASTPGNPASGAPSKPWYAGSTPRYAVSGQPSQPWIAASTPGYAVSGQPSNGPTQGWFDLSTVRRSSGQAFTFQPSYQPSNGGSTNLPSPAPTRDWRDYSVQASGSPSGTGQPYSSGPVEASTFSPVRVSYPPAVLKALERFRLAQQH